ncbi:MAG: FtsX-like permease family protein [Ruminococcus sp.]
MTMKDIEQKLRHANYKQAKLYFFCNFIALMIITAYALLLKSPTILTILPEGGDSRRQMYMIFALTLFGCVVFTIYAASLFFRKKTRQIGILMALGASKKALMPGVFREVLTLSSLSSLAGMLGGIPLIYLLWNSFQLLVESSEMTLHLDYTALLLSGLFILLVIVVSCITANFYLSRTNIIDVIQEEHRNEPVKQLGKWCGPLGLLLILIGAILGYSAPGFWINVFHRYPSVLVNLFYAPVFIGLYLVMLHTVVHGWHSNKKNPYRNIISRSMMKFQGKQTVNNLLVSTVLIAGACFAIFYIPMLGTGQLVSISGWEFDYMYDYRLDQTVPSSTEIEEIAAGHDLVLKDWKEIPYITLAQDGEKEVEDEDNRFPL